MDGSHLRKGFQETVRRSEISTNWRSVDTSPNAEANDFSASKFLFPSGSAQPQSGGVGTNDSYPLDASTVSKEIRGENDPDTLRAIAEGRRLYVGSMPYFAKPHDVQALFEGDDYEVTHINMSIDPYTGRNPSYCFVELTTKEQADRAMQELNGLILLGRPVKIGPGVARSGGKCSRAQNNQGYQSRSRQAPIFNRWNRTDAADHWTGYSEKGRRLWVGGLPHMDGHLAVNNGIRELFKGFEVEAVSRVIIPRQPAFGEAGAWNHRYLFVDFATAEQADRAARATNGKQAWGVKVRVMIAKPLQSRKIGEREAWEQEENPLQADVSRTPPIDESNEI